MHKLLILLFLSFGFSSFGQHRLIKSIAVDKNKQLTTDNLGNSYVYSDLNIIKYNSEGDSIGLYSNNRLGAISSVDVTNPYKIMVFYADYANIIFLDNFMSLMEEPLALDQLGFDQVTLACSSQENGLWIFDRLKQTIIKLNRDLTQSNKSINLSQLTGKQIIPTLMLEQNSNLFLQTINNDILQFDQFGTFEKKISVSTTSPIQIINQQVMFFENDTIFQYNPKFTKLAYIQAPSIGAKTARISKDRLIILTENRLLIYDYKTPKRD
ncbi:hypothetical protein OAB47_05460 [Vicingaceae bacterium]|nr:hypothetical protein [Vicingaceae bacterium]